MRLLGLLFALAVLCSFWGGGWLFAAVTTATLLAFALRFRLRRLGASLVSLSQRAVRRRPSAVSALDRP